jgi:glycosyltransferase involved in cell wall biosynthesis
LNLIFIYAGNLEGSSYKSRLLALTVNPTEERIKFVSMFPGRRFLKNHHPVIKEKFLSFYSSNTSSPLLRGLKVLLGHFNILLYIVFKTTNRDVLYFYNPTIKTTILSLFLAKLMGRQTVVDIVELFQSEKNTWYNRLGDKWAFKYATYPFAISESLIRFGSPYTTKKIVRLPIIVDFKRFDKSIRPQLKLIGYIGTSAAKDGLDVVLRGFAMALRSDPTLKLRLIGPKPIHFDFDKLIAQLDLYENVELTGSKSYEEVPSLLLDCDTYIMNRDNSEFSKYGYPTKLGEYFACERPVLMSNGVGFSQDYTNKVVTIMYEVENANSMADAIAWRYDNNEEAQIIAKNGYDYALTHFASEVVGAKFWDIVQELKKDVKG